MVSEFKKESMSNVFESDTIQLVIERLDFISDQIFWVVSILAFYTGCLVVISFFQGMKR